MRSGGEHERLALDERHKFRERRLTVGRLLELGAEFLAGGEIGQSARVLKHFAQGHLSPGLREGRQSAPDRVVQRQASSGDEREGDRSAERLRDARDPHGIVRTDPPAAPQVRDSRAEQAGTPATLDNTDDAHRTAGHRHEPVQRTDQGGVGSCGRRGGECNLSGGCNRGEGRQRSDGERSAERNAGQHPRH
jgi:hypothetical protein